MAIFPRIGLAFFVIGLTVQAQRKVDARHLYDRIYAAVPMTGAGTYADPKRPLFTPAQMSSTNRTGLIAWHYETSDDGKVALVELVFASKAAMTGAFSTLQVVPLLQSFQKGKDNGEDIERAFRGFKRDFKLEEFSMRVHQ